MNIQVEQTGTLDVDEEIQVLWRNSLLPNGIDLNEEYRIFRRKCEIWVGLGGWARQQDRPDIVSDALCDIQDILGDTKIPIAETVIELRKALNRHRARALRRARRGRNVVPWDDFETAAYRYMKPESQRQANHSQAVEELMHEVLELLRKGWPYFDLALDRLSLRDRTLFHQTYGLGRKPSSHADLTHLTRNAHNVAMYRARQRFLRSLREVLLDAFRQEADGDRSILRELLAMIENNHLKDLLALSRQR